MQGTITKRAGPRGVSWYGKYSYVDPTTGKRKHGRVSAPTRREAEARLREAVKAAEHCTGGGDSRLTVATYLDDWLASKERTVRPATYRRYGDTVRLHLKPVIGGIKLAKLSPSDLDRLYANRIAAGMSGTTLHHTHCILHGALAQALRRGLVSRNVCELVTTPKRDTPEMTVWDASQSATFLAAADDSDFAALWRVALLCGLRRGELPGLRWDDLDPDRGTLAVRRTLSRGTGGTWQLGEPKTATGRRSIALPASCVIAL